MSTQFSKDGKYFAEISENGKIKIWETSTNQFKQEFTPNLHLTTPCTCLHWINNKSQTPWKKKRRHSVGNSVKQENVTQYLALGTSNGSLLLYSLSTAEIESTISTNLSQAISCLTYDQSNGIYGSAENVVLQFNLKERNVKTKWKTGQEKISSILLIPNKNQILTASRNIKLWDIETKEILKTYTGHSSEVILLNYIFPNVNSEQNYFVSASKNDRILSCWNLSDNSEEKNAIASLLMEDIALNVTVLENRSDSANIAAVTRSGVVHIYQQTLNGKGSKPVKPKVTIQVASDTGQNKLVQPIPIISANYQEDSSILIVYGNNLFLNFENVVPNSYEKVQCLIREDPRKINSKKDSNDISKVKEPILDKNVQYLTPHNTISVGQKRRNKCDDGSQAPMEQRLENLTLNKLDGNVPKVDNVAQLLVQGLHSKDKNIIQTVLCKRDEKVIENTIRRLPMPVIIPLLTEISNLIQGKTLSSQIGVLWLRHLIQIHTSQLLANPDLQDLINPILSSIESRLSQFTPLSRLKGRLDLLVTQITNSTRKVSENDDALLVYKDKGSSDSESEEMEMILHSDSEENEEWVETEEHLSSEEEMDVNEIKENNITPESSDSEMS